MVEEVTSQNMSTAGYIQEGKYQKRHCLTFGFLICVTLTLFLLVVAGFTVFGWYLVTNRDREFIITLFEPNTDDTSNPVTYLTDPDDRDLVNQDKGKNYDIHFGMKTTTTSTTTLTTTLKDVTTSRETSTSAPGRPTTAQVAPVVTDDELSDVINLLWGATAETQLVINRDYILSFQGITNATDATDRAPNRLFHRLNVDIRTHSPLHRKFIRLLRAYTALWDQSDVDHVALRNHVTNFLERVSSSNAMLILERFLAEKDMMDPAQLTMSSLLDTIWFEWFASDAGTGRETNGFQRVFVGEPTPGGLTGLNNWVQFFLEEKQKTLNYFGYITKHEVGMVKIKYSWNEKVPQISTFFVGTSPDFEMALYTLCLLTRTNSNCEFTFLGHTVTVMTQDHPATAGLQVRMAHPVL